MIGEQQMNISDMDRVEDIKRLVNLEWTNDEKESYFAMFSLLEKMMIQYEKNKDLDKIKTIKDVHTTLNLIVTSIALKENLI